ncbi:MAG: hypothetical protein MZW92_67055 [Comamonadaceae bacterium]|nr:hypothetical protein [Comamonadaceae bacterium]
MAQANADARQGRQARSTSWCRAREKGEFGADDARARRSTWTWRRRRSSRWPPR